DLAGDDRHRRQQRQVAVGQLDGFEGDAGQADVEQLAGEFRLRRQVQVAEQQVVLAQVLQVAGDRFLDLDDHFALFVQGRRVGSDPDAELGVLLVGEAALGAGTLFQPDLVAALDQVARRGGNERDAPFEGLRFLGNADTHGWASASGATWGIINRRLYPWTPLAHDLPQAFQAVDPRLRPRRLDRRRVRRARQPQAGGDHRVADGRAAHDHDRSGQLAGRRARADGPGPDGADAGPRGTLRHRGRVRPYPHRGPVAATVPAQG